MWSLLLTLLFAFCTTLLLTSGTISSLDLGLFYLRKFPSLPTELKEEIHEDCNFKSKIGLFCFLFVTILNKMGSGQGCYSNY